MQTIDWIQVADSTDSVHIIGSSPCLKLSCHVLVYDGCNKHQLDLVQASHTQVAHLSNTTFNRFDSLLHLKELCLVNVQSVWIVSEWKRAMPYLQKIDITSSKSGQRFLFTHFLHLQHVCIDCPLATVIIGHNPELHTVSVCSHIDSMIVDGPVPRLNVVGVLEEEYKPVTTVWRVPMPRNIEFVCLAPRAVKAQQAQQGDSPQVLCSSFDNTIHLLAQTNVTRTIMQHVVNMRDLFALVQSMDSSFVFDMQSSEYMDPCFAEQCVSWFCHFDAPRTYQLYLDRHLSQLPVFRWMNILSLEPSLHASFWSKIEMVHLQSFCYSQQTVCRVDVAPKPTKTTRQIDALCVTADIHPHMLYSPDLVIRASIHLTIQSPQASIQSIRLIKDQLNLEIHTPTMVHQLWMDRSSFIPIELSIFSGLQSLVLSHVDFSPLIVNALYHLPETTQHIYLLHCHIENYGTCRDLFYSAEYPRPMNTSDVSYMSQLLSDRTKDSNAVGRWISAFTGHVCLEDTKGIIYLDAYVRCKSIHLINSPVNLQLIQTAPCLQSLKVIQNLRQRYMPLQLGSFGLTGPLCLYDTLLFLDKTPFMTAPRLQTCIIHDMHVLSLCLAYTNSQLERLDQQVRQFLQHQFRDSLVHLDVKFSLVVERETVI